LAGWRRPAAGCCGDFLVKRRSPITARRPKSKIEEAQMPNIVSILEEFTGGLSLEEARRNWERAVGGFLDLLGPQEAIRVWKTAVREFLDSLENETAETILEGLFVLMKARFKIDPIIPGSDFGENIKDFTGRYQFRSKKGDIGVLLKFNNGDMHWEESLSQDVNATVEFKDGRALINYLINYVIKEDRDILQSVLNNEIRRSGNLNYLFKYLFMTNHMLLEATGKLP
jgi:hypothetical protein